MKTALCTFPNIDNIDLAVQYMLAWIDEAASLDCDLAVFPEASLGGLELGYDWESDANRSLELSSITIDELKDKALVKRIGIGFGFLERDAGMIYDSYVLLNPQGGIEARYRRISPGWLPSGVDRTAYGCGSEIGFVNTVWGGIGILLCGDLFDDEIVYKIAARKPDLCLHPMARAITYSPDIQSNWDEQELPFYLEQYAKLPAPVLAVNCLDAAILDRSVYCGGAWHISEGRLLKAKPLLESGMLIVDH